jgi:hypothetical protein
MGDHVAQKRVARDGANQSDREPPTTPLCPLHLVLGVSNRSMTRTSAATSFSAFFTGWQTEPTMIEIKDADPVPGKKIISYGKAPWQVVVPQCSVIIKNEKLKQAHILNTAGEIRETIMLSPSKGGQQLTFPADALHVMLTP